MPTAAPPPVPSPPTDRTKVSVSDADQVIQQRIVEACRALWWAELTRSLLQLLIISVLMILAWVVFDQWAYAAGGLVRVIGFLAWLTTVAWFAIRRVLPLLGHSIRPEYAARALERDFPELHQSLTSYVSLRQRPASSTLQGRVLRSIGAATARHLRTHDQLPSETSGTFRWWIATAAVLALWLAYAVISPKNTWQSAARLAAPLSSIQPAMRVTISDVQPGNAPAVAGRSVAVSARIVGLRAEEPALLKWSRAGVDQQVALDFDRQLQRYQGELSLAHSDGGKIPYLIVAGDGVGGPFELTVEDLPVVAIESVHYQPPAYTGASARTSRSGAISGLDGTLVTISAKTNRPVVKAKIEFNPRPLGTSVEATAGAADMQVNQDKQSLSATFPLRSARGRSAAVELDSYQIRVWDAANQQNSQPIIYPVRIISDLPPEIAIMLPTRSPKELPIDAQQVIEIHASDPDFGLTQIGLEIHVGIDAVEPRVLWSDDAGVKGNRIAEYRLRPQELGLRIGDRVNVIASAKDNRRIDHDRSVEPNLTRTDPIELKIVVGGPPPRADDPEADGVTAPEDPQAAPDQVAPDQAEQNPSANNQQDQQPNGNGGSSGSGGATQSQQESSGEENGAGTGTSQESRDSGPPQDQPGGAGERDSTGQGENSSDDSPGQQNSTPADSAAERPTGGQPSPSAKPSSKSPAEQGPPTHDGETFERIRDHLEQKRNQQPGEKPGSDRQPPSSQPRENQSGENQSGENQSGENQSGENQPGEKQPGENQPGENQPGEKQPGEKQSGENQPGEKQSGEKQSGEKQSGEKQSGEKQSGEKQSGENQSGENQSGENQSGENQSGENQSGENQSGENQYGEKQSGENQYGENQYGENQPGEKQPGENQPGENQPGENQSGEKQPGEIQPDGDRAGDDQKQGLGGEGQSRGGDQVAPPQPANVEYTKQATDMVLDYLQQTRDEPDRELLEKLNWSEEDLRRFTDRWQQIREMGENSAAEKGNQELTETLRSLGLQPKSGATQRNTQESADALRGVRDAGNRRPPPAAYRDAFDAFRRAVGRQ
jgi:hypothetical protein